METQVVRFVVEPAYKGWRLDRYLCAKIHGLTRAKASEMIRAGNAAGTLADRPMKPSTFLDEGTVLRLLRERKPEPPTPRELPVVFRDETIIVLDKPAGLPMHAGGVYVHGTLSARVRELAREGEKIDPAHRLDRETSGLVVCGLHNDATRRLGIAFARGEVRKAYLAITEGAPPEDDFEVDLPLSVGGDVVRLRAVVDREAGKPARTRFQVLRRFESDGQPMALIRCEPLTGRQHQIRVHLAERGFPIVGDKLYRDEQVFLRFIDKALTDDDRAALRLERHALHAAELRLVHPATREEMVFESPLPPDLRALLG